MKTLLSLLLQMMLVVGPLMVDGFPFDSTTQEVHVDSLRLRLSDAQQDELVRTGVVTLVKPQVALLQKIYPNVPEKLVPLAATMNDGVDREEVDVVDVFWVAPSEIALTLRPKVGKASWIFADKAEVQPFPHLRLGPDGKIYFGGKLVDVEAATKVIESAPALDGDAGGDKIVRITLPPSYRIGEVDDEDRFLLANRRLSETWAKLQEFALTHKVDLQKCW